ISPDVPAELPITANFNNTPVETALQIITDIAGVYYQIKDNVIYIKLTETKTFHLPYVHALSTFSADLGGDVLGGTGGSYGGSGYGGTGITTGTAGTGTTTTPAAANLKGDFSLQYENPEDANDFYYQLEETLVRILGTPERNGTNPNSFTLNRFSGILVVTATKDRMKQVEKLIKKLKKESRKQVLIEARIVEVTLSKEFRYGVDWNLLLRNFLGTGASVQLIQTLALGTSYGQVYITGADFQSLLNALEQTGEINTLSSPRIRVLNGQTALISSGVVIPFWEKRVSTVTGTTATQQVYYTRTNVLDGILLGVTPYIEKDQIMMNIVPVSTKIEDIRQLVDNGNVVAEAPVLNVKEAGTIIKVKDGDMVIIGGLIGTDKRKVISKIPGLGDIPGIGALFRKEEYINQKKELIIFLRPRIIKVH
ncbi:type II secretion system protein GspD, partial [Persephonella sp.]